MSLRYQAEIPQTDEDKRRWLIRNYNEYALSTIVEELREEQQSLKEARETADEAVLLDSIEEVLVEVARQQADFEAQAESEADK